MMMIVIKITFNSPLNVGIESLSAQLHDSLFICTQVSIATKRFAKKWPWLDVCPKRYSFLSLKVCIPVQENHKKLWDNKYLLDTNDRYEISRYFFFFKIFNSMFECHRATKVTLFPYYWWHHSRRILDALPWDLAGLFHETKKVFLLNSMVVTAEFNCSRFCWNRSTSIFSGMSGGACRVPPHHLSPTTRGGR